MVSIRACYDVLDGTFALVVVAEMLRWLPRLMTTCRVFPCFIFEMATSVVMLLLVTVSWTRLVASAESTASVSCGLIFDMARIAWKTLCLFILVKLQRARSLLWIIRRAMRRYRRLILRFVVTCGAIIMSTFILFILMMILLVS